MSAPLPNPAADAAHPAPTTSPATANVVGVDIALTTYAKTLDWIDATVASRGTGYICVAATHTLMATREDPELRTAVAASSMTVPDGQPIVFALRAFGHRLPDRVYGPTLMAEACQRAAQTGQRMFLYGGRNDDAVAQLSETLRRRYPGLQIVDGCSGPFRPLSPDEQADIATRINKSGADIVWVGLGVPRQERWMHTMRSQLQAPVLVGVGAAFDFHAGLVPQAPPLLQKYALEWAFRLAHEPRRLGKRYTKYNPWFVAAFIAQFTRERVLRRAAPHP